MLADEVGLGKTIEACSVLKVFLSNKAEKRVLITVPRALVAQWRTELLFKFGIMEGENPNGHFLMLRAVEDLDKSAYNCRWDFVIVDEVHNYIKDSTSYAKIHSLSKNADNIILLSATPIQQRKEEYLRLLRLIQPDLYDSVTIGEFSKLVEKQNKISRLTHSLLDDIDSFKYELLPEVEEENPHDDEDVQDQLEELRDSLDELSELINDDILTTMISNIDTDNDDFGLFNFWNQGLNVFRQSLSGLEIIMNDVNKKIIESIRSDFEYGLYRLIPDLIKEASNMRETVQREQIFDTAALRYRPLYVQLERFAEKFHAFIPNRIEN